MPSPRPIPSLWFASLKGVESAESKTVVRGEREKASWKGSSQRRPIVQNFLIRSNRRDPKMIWKFNLLAEVHYSLTTNTDDLDWNDDRFYWAVANRLQLLKFIAKTNKVRVLNEERAKGRIYWIQCGSTFEDTRRDCSLKFIISNCGIHKMNSGCSLDAKRSGCT